MRKIKIFWVILPIFLIGGSISTAATTRSVSQWGITWSFDKDYECGQFANGDYWVKTDSSTGRVVITRIEPDLMLFDGKPVHGFEINPSPYKQGLDGRLTVFDPNLIPSLPYKAKPGDSILKGVSHIPCPNSNCYPGIKTASVLTVVSAIPKDNGSTIFRPPYVGKNKPMRSTAEIKWSRVPVFDPVDDAPSLTWVVEKLGHVQMDHIRGNNMQTRPNDNLSDYGADINQIHGDAVLRLMLNDTQRAKTAAMIAVLQAGIDHYHFILEGQTWPRGGGEQPGRIILPLFSSYILDDPEMQSVVSAQSPDLQYPYEIKTLHENASGIVLWGHYEGYNDEETYWDKLEKGSAASGASTLADPYRFIDGGYIPGDVYQLCCTSQGFKQTALIMNLMPGLRKIWKHEHLLSYADRWVTFGAWTQPDPCAPVIRGGVRGVDYGPDPNHPGMCILDPDLAYYNGPSDFACEEGKECGRFPSRHGVNNDGGYRYSKFAAAMWKAYWRSESKVLAPAINAVTDLILDE